MVVEVDIEIIIQIYFNPDSRMEMSKSDVVELLLFLQWLLIYKQVPVDLVRPWICVGVIVSTVSVEEIAGGKLIIVY